MTEERQILGAGTQRNELVGEVAIDEHVKTDTAIYDKPDNHSIIGWNVGKYDYNGPIHVRIMSVETDKITGDEIAATAKIYYKELDLTADEFIKMLGRIEIIALRQRYKDHFGKEFIFVHED